MAKKYNKGNGQGSVYKLSGNRRNPWIAIVTTGWIIVDGKAKQIRKPIGYFSSQAKAESELLKYLDDPYDLSEKSLTFSDVYEKWSKEYFDTLSNPSSARSYIAAYKHSEPLHKFEMKSIKVMHLEQTIASAKVGDSTKARMKSLYNLMYKYAMKHEIVSTDYAQLCNGIKVGINAPKIPFTDEEIETLWNRRNESYILDMALIQIYSGWRPQELILLRTDDVDLENMTMVGGMKTEAGKNRIVPIHSCITHIIKKFYDPSEEFLFKCEDGTKMTYDKYNHRFHKAMNLINMNHKPHECRHTFITLAKKHNVNEYILKKIVGHTIKDITEGIYTHRDIAEYKREIEKIKAPSS